MRILYGVQTTGRGHVVRARSMIRALKERGHEVMTLFSGPPLEPLWLDATFEPWTKRTGVTHVSVNGRISYLKTALQLRPLRFFADIRDFDAGNADLVISDYEPISARVARRAGIPSIGIGHLYAFAHPVPVAGWNAFNQLIMRGFAPVDMPLGLHWHHFGHPVLPPTISSDVAGLGAVTHDGPILVYLSFESLAEVVAVLRTVREREFRVYAPVDTTERHGNVAVVPISRRGFVEDLQVAAGVICNAGFSLISEALHLGKRVLAKPVRHQTEQESNAKALELLGFGRVCRRLDAETIVEWLARPPPRALNYPDVLAAVLDWIDARRWHGIDALAASLWAQVDGVTANATVGPLERQVAATRGSA